MEDDPVRDGPDAVPAWIVAIRERMRGEVADLLDDQGRLRYDPDAPDAAETGARILQAFGRAAVDQMTEALRRRLASESQGPQTPLGVLGDEDFREDLGEVLRGVLDKLLDESRRDRSGAETDARSQRGGDGTREKERQGRTRKQRRRS